MFPFHCAGRLYIADTNNSVIRYLDLNKEGSELLTLELKGVKPPVPKLKPMRRLRSRVSADTLTIKVDGISSKEGNLRLQISLPEGYHFSKVTPTFLLITSRNAICYNRLDINLLHNLRKLEASSSLTQSQEVMYLLIRWMESLTHKDLQSLVSRGPPLRLQQREYFARYALICWILCEFNWFTKVPEGTAKSKDSIQPDPMHQVILKWKNNKAVGCILCMFAGLLLQRRRGLFIPVGGF